MIFDSHAHYYDKVFDEDREKLLDELPKKGICRVINCSGNIEESYKSIELAEKYDYIFAAVGVHPHEAENLSNDYLIKLKQMLEKDKVVAVGEIGLDYHYDFSPREKQRKVFEEQVKLANEVGLPVIIHAREASEETLEIVKKYQPKGVVHCFSGSLEVANEYIKLGMYIGLGGVVTFKNAKNPLIVAREIPLSSMLIETDAPYMTPVPFRGKRCDSTHINYTAEKIAELRSISKEEVLNVTKENAFKLFEKIV